MSESTSPTPGQAHRAGGPVVAITGGSKGIGRALAIGLAAKGTAVGILSATWRKWLLSVTK